MLTKSATTAAVCWYTGHSDSGVDGGAAGCKPEMGKLVNGYGASKHLHI